MSTAVPEPGAGDVDAIAAAEAEAAIERADARRHVAVIVGSLRRESLNRKLANALVELARPALVLEIVEIGALPLFNADWETAPPPAVTEFKARIRAAAAVLFVTPEYNRSVPGVLKNAIDVGSRPYGDSAWSGKPGAVLTASPGAIGGFGANHHLRQSMVTLGVPMLPTPEVYLGGANALFDEHGAIGRPDTRALLERFVAAFAQWIERNAAPR